MSTAEMSRPTVSAGAGDVRSLSSSQAEFVVGSRFDRLPSCGYLWRLIGLLALGAIFEHYELGLVAPIGLGLTSAGIFRRGADGLFGLPDQATFVFCMFVGLYLGTLLFSSTADRFGRRPIFSFALLWYAAATIFMGVASSRVAIDLLFLVAGIGAGIEMVNLDAYLVEMTPRAMRGKAFAITAVIQYIATPMVGILAWLLIPNELLGISGWRWLCFVPAIGAIGVWWVRRELPESPRWLAAHGRRAEADRVIDEIEARAGLPKEVTAEPLPPVTWQGSPIGDEAGFVTLWRPPIRRRTIMLIVFHLFQTVGYFGFANWLPTLLVSQGRSVTQSLGYTVVIGLVNPAAPLLFSLLADRVERKWQIVAGSLVTAVFGVLMATLDRSASNLVLIGVGVMIAAGLSMMSLAYHTYQSELFPTSVRARGVGFVYSFSRLTAALSSYAIAFALLHAGSPGVFTLIAGSMAVVTLVIALFGPHTRNLSLHEI